MTGSKEDYLRAVYKLSESVTPVSNKRLAEFLNVSPPSVSEMIGTLSKEGYIEYKPYRGSVLTPKGSEEAIKILYNHRLWEVFLANHLGLSWSESHSIAHELEHISSSMLTEKLDEYLEYPVQCPHGFLIPRSGEVENRKLRPLSTLEIGESTYIRSVEEEVELMDYLQNLGIDINMPIVVKNISAYEGPVTLQIGEREIQISFKAAQRIYVD
ncbi:iron (metal) dependent repressor, DtxR family [Anaerosphaera aminiphila DSM 21120]|uniref:Manganese transport regulator n=1 Tax=Anaerosphaera aminiphila DSM 21120 TaxID=1120995 RepID=A0A1M5UEM3_9FIRM|nr:metal-dependent transcriptional regulator [Anaerosphaera aminiphila]SHH61419.1 iron (metal) dependent repressor, DtxR family [Anaerosphaera aminiphila DSM 21120]